MTKNILQLVVVALVVTGCGYTKMTSEEAIRYQSEQLVTTTKTLYAAQPSIPDGDITKVVVNAGGTLVTTPNIYTVDSEANKRDRDAMLRLHANYDSGSIMNEFGGSVKVIAKDGNPTVVYTKVPSTVKCDGIPNVVCERE